MSSALAISIGLLFLGLSAAQVRPPNFSPDALPDTSFTCEDKITGGYYADVEADCQLFHVCVQVSEYEFQDFHFLCPNDTVFDQQHLVCANWFEVDCHQHSIQFFPHDFGFDKSNEEEEYNYDDYPDYSLGNQGDNQHNQDNQGFLGVSQQPPLSSGLRDGGRGQTGANVFPSQNLVQDYDYEQDDDVHTRRPPISFTQRPAPGLDLINPPITTTPIPVGLTTTRRPAHTGPRVKSNILQAQRNKGATRGGGGGGRVGTRVEDDRRKFVTFTAPDYEEVEEEEAGGVTASPPVSLFASPPLISADGKRPRVKANINAGLSHTGKKVKKKGKKQGSKKVELDRSQLSNINFVEPQQDENTTEDPFAGPEVRPDGRPPRVKANVLAKKQHRGRVGNRRPDQTPADPFAPTPKPAADPFTFRPIDIVQPARPPATIAPEDTLGNRFTTPRTFNLPTHRNSHLFTTKPPRTPPPRTLPTIPPRPRPTIPARPRPALLDRPRPTLPPQIRPTSRNRFSNFVPNTPEPPLTFRPLTLAKTNPPPTEPTFDQPSFNFNLPPARHERPRLPPPIESSTLPSFDLGPPPQPKIPPKLSKNRNRFGTRPRVKANELAKQANAGRRRNRFREKQRNGGATPAQQDNGPQPDGPPPTRFSPDPPTSRPRTAFRRPNTNIIKGIGGSAVSRGSGKEKEKSCSNPFKCPPVHSIDGKKPRVKSDIKARRRNFWHPKKSRRRIKNKAILDRIRFRKGRKNGGKAETNDIISDEPKNKEVPATTTTTTTINPIDALQHLRDISLGNAGARNGPPTAATSTTELPKTTRRDPLRQRMRRIRKQKIKSNIRNRFSSFVRTTPSPATTTPSGSTEATIFVTNPLFDTTLDQTTRSSQDIFLGENLNRAKFRDEARSGIHTSKSSFRFPDLTTERARFDVQQPTGRIIEPLFAELTPPPPVRQAVQETTKPTRSRFQDIQPAEEENRQRPEGRIPETIPTRTSLQSPFTDAGQHLFVTNPRALQDHQHSFLNPPKQTADGRKPRVKSNLRAIQQNKPGFFSGIEMEKEEDDTDNENIPTLKIIPDGRAPRVKSDLKNKHKNKKKFSTRIGRGRSLNLDNDSSRENAISDIVPDIPDFDEGPEVRPDGREPRVKSDIKAKAARVGKQSSGKKTKPGFRHSQKVLVTPANLAFNVTPATPTVTVVTPEEPDSSDEDRITTFRPTFSLETLGNVPQVTTAQPARGGRKSTKKQPPSSIFAILDNIGSGKRRHEGPTSEPRFSVLDLGRRRSRVGEAEVGAGEKPTEAPRILPQRLTVPLPNLSPDAPLKRVPHSERFAQAVFKPAPKGFKNKEPVFSDFPKSTSLGGKRKVKMKPTPESATVIIKVTKQDKKLFDGEYYYDYYYYEDHPF